jgi:hypothetical protein
VTKKVCPTVTILLSGTVKVPVVYQPVMPIAPRKSLRTKEIPVSTVFTGGLLGGVVGGISSKSHLEF